MSRARLAAHSALVLVLLVGASVALGGAPPDGAAPDSPASLVPWPTSDGLLVAEVVTGEASASDELIELTNAGSAPIDLAGLEVAYVTSSGSTVTRKAVWTTSVVVEPGRHLLLANALGRYASIADATYSGGLAATGGTVVLRPVGGEPIDAVGWGDASNSYVEGSAAPAPPAGSSVERLPGGLAGNTQDTNENSADLLVNPSPVAQNLAAPPAPAPGPSASPTPDPGGSPPAPSAPPSATPTPLAPTPSPTVAATIVPTPDPSGAVSPSPSVIVPPTPTPAPTPTATPTPTPEPSPSPAPSPSPSPTVEPSSTPTGSPGPGTSLPPPLPIADARLLADGTSVDVDGIVTAGLGVLEAGRGGFIQDATGGIAVYLDAAVTAAVPAGTRIRAHGTIDDRYAQRTLRVRVADLTLVGPGSMPAPLVTVTGEAGEHLEGLLVVVEGTIVQPPDALADGTGLVVDDGTGPLRVIVGVEALGTTGLRDGDRVRATGPLGQRDSTGTGLVGYRLNAMEPGGLIVLPPPAPSPTAAPSGTPAPPPVDPTPAPTLAASPSPTPVASPSPSPLGSLAGVRLLPIGSSVTVRGAVTAEAGRLGTPPLFVIGDMTGGLAVKLPEGAPAPARDTLVQVTGVLAAPFGQLELRPRLDGLGGLGPAVPPAPATIDGAEIGEETEGRLVALEGVLSGRPQRATSGDLSATLTAADGTAVRIMADASAGLDPALLVVGERYAVTGVVGQRASRKGLLDGYRVWLRDADDATRLGDPAAGGREDPVATIAEARLALDETVVIEGTVTAPATLLDSTGRRTVLEDPSGAIELYLPAALEAPAVGTLVRAEGIVGRAYGAPRLRVATMEVLGTRTPLPMRLVAAPGPAHEWRLVVVSGTVVDIRRLGERWWADLQVGRDRVPIAGLAGSGIPASTLAEGRPATVTGIVRRPYPSAVDRRFAVVPRGARDLALGPATALRGMTGAANPRAGSPAGDDLATRRDLDAGPLDVDLAGIEALAGRTVRVGGLIVELRADGLVLDDGTARGLVVLRGTALDLLPLLEPGDALNVIGRPEVGSVTAVVVDDPDGLRLVGELGSEAPLVGGARATGGAVARQVPLSSVAAGPEEGSGGPWPALLLALALPAIVVIRRRAAGRRLGARAGRGMDAAPPPADWTPGAAWTVDPTQTPGAAWTVDPTQTASPTQTPGAAWIVDPTQTAGPARATPPRRAPDELPGGASR